MNATDTDLIAEMTRRNQSELDNNPGFVDYEVALGLTTAQLETVVEAQRRLFSRVRGPAMLERTVELRDAKKGDYVRHDGVIVRVTKRQKEGVSHVRLYIENCGNGLPGRRVQDKRGNLYLRVEL